jgi:outer membrane biogenesis lipoprotein LolB
MRNRLALLVLLVVVSLLTGCASVPMASVERDAQAKSFTVKSDKANIYVFRNESMVLR